MPLVAACPRCRADVQSAPGDRTRCPVHGEVTRPLWQPADPASVSYDEFAAHLAAADGFPTYLPWPMSPGWSIADFGCVGTDRVRATVTTTVGTSDLDGEVEVTIVSEEPGIGHRIYSAEDLEGHRWMFGQRL